MTVLYTVQYYKIKQALLFWPSPGGGEARKVVTPMTDSTDSSLLGRND
jgi:hypothetical protein